MNLSERQVRGPDGKFHDRQIVVDRSLPAMVDGVVTIIPQRPETDAEVLARVECDAQEEAKARAYQSSEAGKLAAARAEAMGMDPQAMRGWDFVCADARIRANKASDAYREALAPGAAARAKAVAAKRALPFQSTNAEQAAVQALEDEAVLLSRAVDPALLQEVQAADAALERIEFDRRHGAPVPRAPEPLFQLSENDRNLLAHLLEVDSDAPSDVYGDKWGVGLPSGSIAIRWRELYNLAGLSTAGRRFDDDGQPASWVADDQGFLRSLSNCLNSGLLSRFNLSEERGAAIRKRENEWAMTRPTRLGVVSG